jgi:hypothetical protein
LRCINRCFSRKEFIASQRRFGPLPQDNLIELDILCVSQILDIREVRSPVKGYWWLLPHRDGGATFRKRDNNGNAARGRLRGALNPDLFTPSTVNKVIKDDDSGSGSKLDMEEDILSTDVIDRWLVLITRPEVK